MDQQTQKARVIIVQEDEPARLSLRAGLEADNYYVAMAESGAGALDKMKKQFFDIIYVDYKLPDINGIEFIKQAMAFSGDSVPVLVTGQSSLEVAVESMRIGAHDYIVKPVNIDDLKKNFENILVERNNLNKGREKLESVIKAVNKAEEELLLVATPDDGSGSGPAAKKGMMRRAKIIYRALKSFFWDID